MPWWKLFAGATPEQLEQHADARMASRRWGEAKQDLERALQKLENTNPPPETLGRLKEKLTRALDALAREHQHGALLYADGGHDEDARELLALALSVAADPDLKRELQDQLAAAEANLETTRNAAMEDIAYDLEDIENQSAFQEDYNEDEAFFALCQTLPDEIRQAYLGYGRAFEQGYMALNQGNFAAAVPFLIQALAENPSPDSYIPLELATAYANLNDTAAARPLLEAFIQQRPEALPAYTLLCEIYWEEKEFEKVAGLLAALPRDLQESLAVVLLKGRNLLQAGRYAQAQRFYEDVLDRHGWHDSVALDLAQTLEALNQGEAARALYQEIINTCTSCRTPVDPQIKHRFAELSFALGHRDTTLLETYLSLALEMEPYRALYYDRVSRIYTDQGHTDQARRFQVLAQRAK